MSEIRPIHTPCKKCVFAQYEDKTQTGCCLDYIERYKNNGVEILEVYDNENEFFVINEKKCIGYRENSWFRKYDLEHASLEDKVNKFNEINNINYLMVIDLKKMNYDNLDLLSSKIKELKFKPGKVIFVRYFDEALKFDYDKITSFLNDCNLSQCEWRIQTMEDNDALYADTIHTITNTNKKYRFILSVSADQEDFPVCEVVNKANSIVVDDLGQFVVVSNALKNVFLYSTPSYRYGIVVEKKNILEEESGYTYI